MSAKGQEKGAATTKSIEELWERAGYLVAAAGAAVDAYAARTLAASSADAAQAADAAAVAAYARGMARWEAEHPEEVRE
jgi:hypothetical protein